MANENEDKRLVFLLESEVAQRLRCSTSKVKRLRLSGKLPYIPGRPNLISLANLIKFIEDAQNAATASKIRNTGMKKTTSDQDIATLARQIAMRQRMSERK